MRVDKFLKISRILKRILSIQEKVKKETAMEMYEVVFEKRLSLDEEDISC